MSSSDKSTSYSRDRAMTHKLESQRRYLREKYANLNREVVEMEVQLNIPVRWRVDDESYIAAMQYIAERKY